MEIKQQFETNVFGVIRATKAVIPTIRKAAIKESTKFLDSIGTAEMEHEIEKRVIAMTAATRENME